MALFKASSKATEGSEPSPSSSGSAAPGPKGAFGSAVADLRSKRYPRALLFAVVSYVIVAIALFFSQVGQPETTVDNPSENAVQGVGGQIAPSAQEQWFVPLLPYFGIVVLVAAVALFVGIGWARLVLAVLGILMVVGLAEAQEQVQAVAVAVFTLLGAILSLLLPSHRYLNGTTPAAADGPAQSDDTATGRTVT